MDPVSFTERDEGWFKALSAFKHLSVFLSAFAFPETTTRLGE